MSDLYWCLLLFITAPAYFFLGYSRGRLFEIRERIRQREVWYRQTLEMNEAHKHFVRQIAEHFHIELPPEIPDDDWEYPPLKIVPKDEPS